MSWDPSLPENGQDQKGSWSRSAGYEKARVVANYLELATLEYVQRCSGDSGMRLDDSTGPLFCIMSCWKLLWCLSMNELIGECLRDKIEENFTFRTDVFNSNEDFKKLLSIPQISEGEVSRFAMAYSPLFRVVLGVLRWLRWESRVNPYKQDDFFIRETYFVDYPESRIAWKTMKNQKRFYGLDWPLNTDQSFISCSDRENVEEVFKVAFMLLRKGCRMQLDEFLRDRAKAHWLGSLVDGMDPYLCPEKQNDYFAEISNFIDIIPKIDEMWLNYNEEEEGSEPRPARISLGAFEEGRANKELGFNEILFKEYFEFVDSMERSLIFPVSEGLDSGSSGIDCEGNVDRSLLFHFLRKVLAESRSSKPATRTNLGEWELSFYSILCGDFEQLYSRAGDDFDKLFALFQTQKINIFNEWADFLESRTQNGRNNVFLGKIEPEKGLEDALYKRLKLLTRDSHPEVSTNYLLEDCESISEFNLITQIQAKLDFGMKDTRETNAECDETHAFGYNSSFFHFKRNSESAVDMVEFEKQLIDSLVDSISYLDRDRNSNTAMRHFFDIYTGIIVSFLSPKEHGNELISILEEFMNYTLTLGNEISCVGSLKAFISQLVIAHLEIEGSIDVTEMRNYSVYIFDEFNLASLPSMDSLDTLDPSEASIQFSVLTEDVIFQPLHNIPEGVKDRAVTRLWMSSFLCLSIPL
ncbi:hypothetical protein HWI79_2489 [Cryptosporidium felis]|nr:hypothetical protein HWI79_2489 [Cryptosporidium felis]